MIKRNLGKSGLQVSLIGLGCNNFGWKLDLEGARAVVHKALDAGITLFDTADIYGGNGGSETILGQVLGDRRKEVIVATKFGGPMNDAGTLKGASRRYILSAVEASLRRLGTDWIDLYQLHFPDPLTPMEETLRALDDLVRQGKGRYIGSSNLTAWQVVEAHWIARELGQNAFISCQNEYSLVLRDPERGKMPQGARLTDTKRLADRYMTEANLKAVEALDEFATKRGHTLLELAFSWLAARPVVSSVIAGATKPEQVEQNAKAADWALTADEIGEIDRLSKKT